MGARATSHENWLAVCDWPPLSGTEIVKCRAWETDPIEKKKKTGQNRIPLV